jgi:hypothetical protein
MFLDSKLNNKKPPDLGGLKSILEILELYPNDKEIHCLKF